MYFLDLRRQPFNADVLQSIYNFNPQNGTNSSYYTPTFYSSVSYTDISGYWGQVFAGGIMFLDVSSQLKCHPAMSFNVQVQLPV